MADATITIFQENSMAKKKVGPSISATAKIEKITCGRKGDVIKFDELITENFTI